MNRIINDEFSQGITRELGTRFDGLINQELIPAIIESIANDISEKYIEQIIKSAENIESASQITYNINEIII